MAQARRGKGSSGGLNISSGGKRAKNAKDHYQAISNKRRFLVFLGCFAIIVIVTIAALVNSFSNLNDLNQQKALLEEQKQNLELTQERLAEEVEYTNTKEFIEYMARKLLGWINPTDKKYVIIED